MSPVVKEPLPFAPHRCLVTSRDDGDLLDFGDVNVNEPIFRLYLQRGVIEEAAREVGMVSGEEIAEVREQLATLGQRLDEALKDAELLGDLDARFGKEFEGGVTAGVNLEPPTPGSPEADAIEIEAASPAGTKED